MPNEWAGSVKSGPGSALEATELVREGLTSFFRDFNVAILVDAPCGDGTWMYGATAQLYQYLGIDMVPQVVA